MSADDAGYCRHCGNRIYRSAATGRWLHGGNLDVRCKGVAFAGKIAEPRQEDK